MFIKRMCHHTGLIVCFACLFLSTGSSSNSEKNTDADVSCSTVSLYEKHSVNGSLSLEALDMILSSFRNICFSNSETKEQNYNSSVENVNHNHKTLEETNDKDDTDEAVKKANAWLYAGFSVLFISTCGLAAVAAIKILPVWLFQPTIQFLVALAVGTLTGDAILHLIPHAFVDHGTHEHSKRSFHSEFDTHASHEGHTDDSHDDNVDHSHDQSVVWRGVLVLAILLTFFVMERLLNIFGEWKQRLQSNKQVDKVAHLLTESSKIVGEKLCRHHQENHQSHHNHEHLDNTGNDRLLDSRGPAAATDEPAANLLVNCAKEVAFSDNGDAGCANAVPHEVDCARRDDQSKGCSDWQGLVVGHPLIYCASHDICDGSDARTAVGDAQRNPEAAHSDHLVSLKARSSENNRLEDVTSNRQMDSLTLYISEHHTSHHGHSHSHGHIHARPHGVASLAWLVLAGDGIHNLTDGLAIGAAFAASLTGGFTTAFAVLCHELPHELGDFAVLLKAGMTVKQAMVCNLISSFLCLIGVLLGLAIGSAHETSQWIFAATGGMFIYIALVDMMPELNGHVNKNRSAFLVLAIQMAGMLCGFGIMLVIALYEHEFKRILKSLL